MADKAETPEKKEGEGEEAEQAPKSKKGLFLGGGVAGAIALAYITFLMAVPSVEKTKLLDGPFVSDLTVMGQDITVNLNGNDGRDFLGIGLRAEFASYDEGYVPERTADPLYKAMLDHSIRLLLADMTKSELSGKAGKEILTQELLFMLDPILFPIHIGATETPNETDSDSGLRPGVSAENATWRGLYYEHVLHVDGPDRTLGLDDGAKVGFAEGDDDVRIVDENGDFLFVDTSGLDPSFVGDLKIGVMGKVRRIFFSSLIFQ